MMRDIFVVCRTKAEFKVLLGMASQFWDFELKRRMVHFVESADTLKGIAPCRVFLFGSYFKRRDWIEIQAAIVSSGHSPLRIR